ncbi:MAG: efflux RND transporter periplasmic adaptor subunit [Thermoanaerobaculum sp.]
MSRNAKWVIVSALLVGATAAVVASRKGDTRGSADPPVSVAKVELADVQVEVVEVGTVEPEVKVDVKSALSGKVVALPVREGDTVKKGQLIAAIEPDVNQAQTLAAVRRAVAQQEIEFADAEKDFLAKDELLKAGLVSLEVHRAAETRYKKAKEALEAAREKATIVESSGVPLSTNPQQVLHIVSPMDGVVIRRPVELGEAVTGAGSFNAGTVIATVADLSRMIVKAGVSEVDIGKVAVAAPVEVTLDAFPKAKFTGKVSRIAPAARLDRDVKVYDVEVVLDAQGKELRTGMTANVKILGEKATGVLTVPVEAVFRKDDKDIVYVRKTATEGKASKPKATPSPEAWKFWFEERVVETGIASLSRVHVVSGLSAGDEVALEDPTRPKKKES